MEGHPIKRLRGQTFEDLEQEIASFSRPCVTLVDKRQQMKHVSNGNYEEENKINDQQEPLIRPIRETNSTELKTQDDLAPRKKQSLFAQRIKDLKSECQNKGYPSVFKLEHTQASKETSNLLNLNTRIDGVDSEIHQENLNKIQSMSKQEIMEELQSLRQSLNPKLLAKLKKLGKHEDVSQDSPKEKNDSSPLEQSSQCQEQAVPLETKDVGSAVTKATNDSIQKQKYIRSLTFNYNGELKQQNFSSESHDDRYISYIMQEDFLQLDQRFFSLRELESLLASSDLYQRHYALRLLKALVNTEAFSLIMNHQYSQIGQRLKVIMQMNLRIDGIILLFDVLESVMGKFLKYSSSLIQESLIVDGDFIYRSNLRPFNFCLEAFSSESTDNQLFYNDVGLLRFLWTEQTIDAVISKANLLCQSIFTHSTIEQSSQSLGLRLKLMTYLAHFDNNFSQKILQSHIIKNGPMMVQVLVNNDNFDYLEQLIELFLTISLFSKDNAVSIRNLTSPELSNYVIQQSLKEKDENKLVQKFFTLQMVLLGYDLISLKPYSLALLEIMKNSNDSKLLAIILNCMMIEAPINKEITQQLVLPCLCAIEQRKQQIDSSLLLRLKIDQSNMLLGRDTKPFDNTLQQYGNETIDIILIKLQTVHQQASQFEEIMQLLKSKITQCSDIETQIVKLSLLSHYKDYAFSLIKYDKISKIQILAFIDVIMQLLSINDEYFLMVLLTKLFDPDNNSIMQNELYILQNFYLGYCGSDKQTYDVSQPNYEDKPNNQFPQSIIRDLSHYRGKDLFLPLMNDWFFKPLLYINKPDDKGLQLLTQAIMNYATQTFLFHDSSYAQSLLGISAAEMVLVCLHILLDDGLYFSKKSKEAIFYFIQKLYFIPNNDSVIIQPLGYSQSNVMNDAQFFNQNLYLLSKHASIFLKEAVSSKIVKYFNYEPIEENPILLFILILLLQTQLDVELRKTILNDLQEIMPQIMRSEKEHIKFLVGSDSFKLYKIESKNADEWGFYEKFLSRLEKSMCCYPDEVIKEMRKSLIYQIIKINFE